MDNWSAPVGPPTPVGGPDTRTVTGTAIADDRSDLTLTIAGTDLPPAEVDLTFAATVLRPTTTEFGPPVARVAVTNHSDGPLQVTTGHRPLFSAVHSEDGRALLVEAGPYSTPALESIDDDQTVASDRRPAPSDPDAEAGSVDDVETVTLGDGIEVPLVMSGVPVDPGVTASVDLAVLSAERGAKLRQGTYRFEDSYAVYPPEDGTDSVGFDWGFSVQVGDR